MLNKFIIPTLLFGGVLTGFSTKSYAQVNLYVDATALQTGKVSTASGIYSVQRPSISNSSGVNVSSYGNNLISASNSTTFPVSAVRLSPLNAYLNPDPGRVRMLNTTQQQIFVPDGGGSIFGSDLQNFYITYDIPSFGGYTWLPGTYSTTVFLTGTSNNFLTAAPKINPASFNISVNVASVLSADKSALPPNNIKIDNLATFRNDKTSSTIINNLNSAALSTVVTTVPFYVNATTTQPNFTYINDKYQSSETSIPVSGMNWGIFFPVYYQSSVNNNNPGLINPPVGNKVYFGPSYDINLNNLKASFARKGTYKTSINFMFAPYPQVAGISSFNVSQDFSIEVPDLSEIKVNTNSVDFDFRSASHYSSGLSVPVTNQLSLSNTVAYDLSVKSDKAFFTETSTGRVSALPCRLVRVRTGLVADNTNTTVTLSTSAQNILDNQQPVIDRDLNITYTILPDPLLMSAKRGSYTLNLIYTLTAH